MKKKTLGQLKKDLWKVFSLYIRQRDNWTCFTCGRVGEGSGIHAGHFISKRIGGIELYFHEDNVHAQCYNCNINLGGNQYIYGERLGKKKVEELRFIQHSTHSRKWTEEMYINRINYYKNLIQ